MPRYMFRLNHNNHWQPNYQPYHQLTTLTNIGNSATSLLN